MAVSPSILSPQLRAKLFNPPADHDEAQRRYALAPEDLALCKRHRRPHNRLGFAVQLALVRDLGRPLRLAEHVPTAVLETVGEQIGITPAIFDFYARRDETRREHVGEIVACLGLRTIRQADYRAAIMAGAAAAVATDMGEPIVRAIIDDLKVRRIIVPTAPLVERFALAGRALARRQAHRNLIRGLDAQHAEPLATIWGPGTTASSDGQFFPAGGRGEAAADYNARHGSEPGAVFYDFLSDRFASFYSKVIPAAASEAPHVLDGLLHHESTLEIHEHATDTAGAVESVFALFHLFGYRFAPRIRDLGGRKLFVIDKQADYGPLTPLIGAADLRLVEENWEEVLRLAASLRAGTVPPSVMLKKIGAFPRQNALHKALREIGRIERSIFMADWLLDLELRRRSHGNLNKGESRHALARAVFFHRLGALRDRTAEAMAYRASGLNLVVNAIILWNTTYLARAVGYVRGQGIDLPDGLLSHVAPVKWDHIALTGDYLWSEIERPRERFRPLRTNRFDPVRFQNR